MGKRLGDTVTAEQAREFVNSLFQELFTDGDEDAADDFYHPDVVGHFQDGLLNMDDIKGRIRVMKEQVREPRYDVIWCQVIDNLIIYTCQQSWVAKADDTYYDATAFIVYRLDQGKIAELWLEVNADTPSYQTINQAFLPSIQGYEVNTKKKQNFLRKLEHYFQGQHYKSLTPRQAECLYYYLNGFSSKEAARQMDISPRTFESYINQVKDIVGCNNKSELRQKIKIA